MDLHAIADGYTIVHGNGIEYADRNLDSNPYADDYADLYTE